MLYRTDNPHGGDIYSEEIHLDFSSSINPLGTPERVIDVMRYALMDSASYPDPYCRAALSAVSDYESVSQAMILFGNGAAELIYSFCSAFKPKKAVQWVPTFSEYETALRLTDCEVLSVPLKEENDFEPDESLCRAVRESGPDVVFLCHPNNPTGRLISSDLLKEILRVCRQTGARLFVDECFLSLSGGGEDLTRYLEEDPGLVVLKAFTKNFALAGVRIGYCMSSDLMLLLKMSDTVQPWNVSTAAQAAAAAAVRETEYLRRSLDLIRIERTWLAGQLTALGFRVIPSDTNFLLFKGPAGLAEQLRREKIAIRDCANFRGLDPGWYRTAVRKHEENLSLIRAIGTLMGKAT